jgi:hypothetical protein
VKFANRVRPEALGLQTKKAKTKPAKPGKGWIAVNMSEWEERKLRALAFAAGLDWASFCVAALRSFASKQAEIVGLSSHNLRDASKSDLLRLRRRSLEIRTFQMALVPVMRQMN